MYIDVCTLSRSGLASPFLSSSSNPPPKADPELFPRLVSHGMGRPLAEPVKTATHKDPFRVFFNGKWHIYGTGHEMRGASEAPTTGRRPHQRSVLFHLTAACETGPYVEENPPLLLGNFPPGVYEAPTLAVQDGLLHLYVQTTYYLLGGSIEHFTSRNGHQFTWEGTALKAVPGGHQSGIYDVDAGAFPASGGKPAVPFLCYSGFSRGGRDERPDPCVFLAEGSGWEAAFRNGDGPILTDADVPWHNPHHPANPYYEWGLEGAQLLPLPDGNRLLLCVGFERRPSPDYMAAQRLFFALYSPGMKLRAVSDPILPRVPGWDEYGHGHMIVDAVDPDKLRLLYQARPANVDNIFRDSDTWRLFEAIFDISAFRRR
jgi:hypothetical protein